MTVKGLYGNTKPLCEVMQGFRTAVTLELLAKYLVTASDLAAMVCGVCSTWHDTKQIQDVFRLVLDPQLEQQYQDLAACLWEVHLYVSAL